MRSGSLDRQKHIQGHLKLRENTDSRCLLAATGQYLERKIGNLSLTPFAPTNPERINDSTEEPLQASRQGSKLQRGGNENPIQVDFVNMDQTGELGARRFIVSIFKTQYNLRKLSGSNQSHPRFPGNNQSNSRCTIKLKA